MAHLYELAEQYNALLNAIESGDIPEEAIADTLEGLEGELDDKIENIAVLIKELGSEAEALREEEKSLAERRKVKENACERLKNYLTEQMLLTNRKKIDRPRALISLRATKSVDIYDEKEFIDWALDNDRDDLVGIKYTPSKTEIKRAIDNGSDVPFVAIVEKKGVTIK